jgi:hypothetical protein
LTRRQWLANRPPQSQSAASMKRPYVLFRRLSRKDLLKRVSAEAELPSDILLRKGRLAQARGRFIREAVLKQGYLSSRWPNFLPPPSIERKPGATEALIDLGKSDTRTGVRNWRSSRFYFFLGSSDEST